VTPDTDILDKAFALLAEQPDLYRLADEMHLHFLGRPLDTNAREQIPGIVLRWLNCACDLELWQEAFAGRTAPRDLDATLDFIARLEDLGVEAIGETRCIDCGFRKRCR
jgi:hypothetical protein